MDRLVYHNDRIVDAAEARLPITSAGALYGWGVFSTLRIYEHRAFEFDRHWERLVKHAERAHVPITLDIEQARNATAELIQASRASSGRVRITALRGEAGVWSREQAADGELIIFTSSDQLPSPRDAAITVSPYRVLSHGPLAGVKRTAMLDNVLALEEARSRGFAEAVMFNERGEIVGATAANIFWSEGEEIITPSLGTGCVAGVTRSIVLEIARREKIPVVEGGFPVQRLLEANQVFLTSTVKEITPVSEFDHKRYTRAQWSSAQRVEREFQKLIRNARITR